METQILIQQLEGFERDMNWINKHYDELKREYVGEYIAVLNENIVDHDKNLGRLRGRLETRYHDDYDRAAIKFISLKKVELIL